MSQGVPKRPYNVRPPFNRGSVTPANNIGVNRFSSLLYRGLLRKTPGVVLFVVAGAMVIETAGWHATEWFWLSLNSGRLWPDVNRYVETQAALAGLEE
mmetsp:Transcript_18182/g.20223  ORF Transcript_18182/g.20223 Transcript_18182/m.20223 type:complete len:98 (+) Transcript_18182:41-334(+)